MGRRRYHQYCPVARALDVVGERWTLLIARELLLGPRRFTDLADGLPGIGSSVLTARLADLEQSGLVAKRTLPPPAASVVYELTDEARGLARVLAALADWGMNLLGRPGTDDQVRWPLAGAGARRDRHASRRPSPTPPTSCESTTRPFTSDRTTVDLEPADGPASNANATITLTTDTLAAIASGELDVPSPRADRLIAIDGDTAGAQRLLESLAPIRVSTDTGD